MKLVLDQPQQMLAKTASDFASKNDGITRLRELRNNDDPLCYAPGVWQKMADLGWTAIPFSEDFGGLGMGMAEVILITEALGRGLAPEPYVSAVVLAGSLLEQLGSDSQKKEWIEATVSGEKRLAVAHQEAGSRYDLDHVAAKAEKTSNGFVLSGTKLHVIDGFDADGYIVSVRTSGKTGDKAGISLFLVPKGRPGLEVTRQKRVDSRNAAIVALDRVEVALSDALGDLGSAHDPLETAVDRATVALCGEMLGAMSEAFERTLVYLGEREQFGVKIGTFQALKHRAAKMFVERELARSSAMAAARALDENEGTRDARVLVSNAKARCSDALILLTNEALQMHGGIGMTDEHDIGLFMKRARVCELTFGDAAYHRNRFAQLQGY
jgi:alkylation response protein AidB-like acyl-CoA dehydrogenase